MDKDKLIGNEEIKKITSAEIDAYHRGKDDAKKSARLTVDKLKRNMSDKAIYELVEVYARNVHLEQMALRFGLTKQEITGILKALGIETGADARTFLLNKGNNSLSDEAEQKRKHAEAQARLDEENKKKEKAKVTVVHNKKEIAHKNKLDKVREMLSNKINKSTFRVDPASELEFKNLVIYGLTAIRRKFGSHLTEKEIKSEIKRLVPGVSLDLIRP